MRKNFRWPRSHRMRSLFAATLALLVVADGRTAATEPERQVVQLGPGVFDMPAIVLDKPHALLKGAGRGITIVRVVGGITATAPEPVIRDLTIIGNGSGVGLTLRDVWSARVDDVEIESYDTGILIELTDEGRRLAGGKTLRGWPSALTKGKHWGSRVTLTELRGIEVIGDGDGIVLRNRLKDSTVPGKYWKATNDERPGEFFTATTIQGGHIKVGRRSLVIGDGVWATTVIGTYFDIGAGGGVVIEFGAHTVKLIGSTLDLSYAARQNDTARLTVTRKSLPSLTLVGNEPRILKRAIAITD